MKVTSELIFGVIWPNQFYQVLNFQIKYVISVLENISRLFVFGIKLIKKGTARNRVLFVFFNSIQRNRNFINVFESIKIHPFASHTLKCHSILQFLSQILWNVFSVCLSVFTGVNKPNFLKVRPGHIFSMFSLSYDSS